VSTYANLALRPGFADALRAAGVTGLIVPTCRSTSWPG